MEARRQADILWQPPGGTEVRRYALSAITILALGGGAIGWIARTPLGPPASQVDDAVLIDLQPAEASSRPRNDAEEGPPQPAAQASIAPPKLDRLAPPKPVEAPKPAETRQKSEAPPPVVKPDPPAVLPPKQDKPTPAPVAPPPSPAQEAHAPSGSETPVKSEADDETAATPHASTHAITAWQKSLMRRLEAAKRRLSRTLRGEGTVRIAFAIDATGAITTERIAATSGSGTLDREARDLVADAAPYPKPPPGTGPHDMSFIVPIQFQK